MRSAPKQEEEMMPIQDIFTCNLLTKINKLTNYYTKLKTDLNIYKMRILKGYQLYVTSLILHCDSANLLLKFNCQNINFYTSSVRSHAPFTSVYPMKYS